MTGVNMDLHRRHRPDPSTADRLLAGRVEADDAPPGYRRVAALLGNAGNGFPSTPDPVEAETVSAMVAIIGGESADQSAPRRSPVLSKLLAAKTIAAVSFVALSAGGAAAAGGHLPGPVQSTVADAAEVVGVELPDGHGAERVTEDCQPAEDGTAFSGNRGQYLKQERAKGTEALAEAKASRCGMPVQSKGTPGADEAGDDGDDGEAGDADETEATEISDDSGTTDETDEAGEGNGKAGDDHGQAGDDHGQAGDDHGQAGDDHGQAGDDHGQAGDDHGQAGDDAQPDDDTTGQS
ncbi:MAG: hypothetical protein ACRDZ3_04870, partial [Acidimicrobiia bacterium]